MEAVCGRFSLTTPGELIAETFGLDEAPELQPRYNIAPTQPVLAVRRPREDDPRELVPLRWGLMGPGLRDPSQGPPLINARAETAARKPAFREAFRHRRCLIPADGFYEWQGEKGAKVPHVIRPRTGGLIAFAGVWRDWRGEGGVIPTCAIITCPANATLAPIHDRMPVVIGPGDFGLWLGQDGPGAARLMQPAPDALLEATPADAATRAALRRRG